MMRATAIRTASELVLEDERVAMVLAEISLTQAADALARAPLRVVNVGIMEQTAVGVAAGLALEGMHPIVHTITPFLVERPYEQLKVDFGYQRLGGSFISTGASYDYSTEGGTHHSPGDVHALLAIPGFEVLVPGHPAEVEQLLRATYANGRPTYLRTSVAANAEPRDVVPGRLEVVRRGARGTVVAVGPMLERALPAATELDLTVLYATSIEPFDAARLRLEAADHELVVAVEPFYEGTLARTLAEALAGRPARIGSIGVPRAFLSTYGTVAELDRDLGMDEAGVRQALVRWFAEPA